MSRYTVVSGALLTPSVGWLIAKRAATERVDPSVWEFPGGKLEEGERPTDALVREWKEELDLDVEVISGVVARCVFQPPIFDDVDISLYVVKRRVEAAPLKLKLSVHEAIRFVEFSELLRMSIYEVTPATHHFAATMLRREMEAEYERVARVRR